MNVEKANKQSFNLKKIDKTPFHVVEENGEYWGIMGRHRLTEFKKTEEEVINELKEITWDRVIQVIMILKEK